MNYESNIRLVYTHPEGNGGDHDLNLIFDEGILIIFSYIFL